MIAGKYIDSDKHGPKHYFVEVTAQKNNGSVDAYARIYIYSDWLMSYFHNCGVIGSAVDMDELKQKFGEILCDGKSVQIGTYYIEEKKYESHC